MVDGVKTHLPYMRLYWGDYLADTQHLSTVEHGAYLLLIAHYFSTGRPLPDDMRQLMRITKTNRRAVVEKVLSFFTYKDGVYVHHRIEHELARARSASAKRRESGKLGASTRWLTKFPGNKKNTQKKSTSNSSFVSEPKQTSVIKVRTSPDTKLCLSKTQFQEEISNKSAELSREGAWQMPSVCDSFAIKNEWQSYSIPTTNRQFMITPGWSNNKINTHTITGSEVEKGRSPLWPGCVYLRLSEAEYEKAQAHYRERGYPPELLTYAMAEVERWLSGDTPAALKARRSKSHVRQLFASWVKQNANTQLVFDLRQKGGRPPPAPVSAAQKKQEFFQAKLNELRGEVYRDEQGTGDGTAEAVDERMAKPSDIG